MIGDQIMDNLCQYIGSLVGTSFPIKANAEHAVIPSIFLVSKVFSPQGKDLVHEDFSPFQTSFVAIKTNIIPSYGLYRLIPFSSKPMYTITQKFSCFSLQTSLSQ